MEMVLDRELRFTNAELSDEPASHFHFERR